MAIKLIIEPRTGRTKKIIHNLDQPLITFGRSKSCHIELDDPGISRRHFTIKFVGDSNVLVDEGSRQGTIIDGIKLESNKPYPVDNKHFVEVPGFFINLFCDGQKPKLECSSLVAGKLLDELLQGGVEVRECSCLQSKNGIYHFNFIEEKTFFVLGKLPHVDFFIKEESIGKEHISFVRDINGIRLNPLPGHDVYINGIHIVDPEILTHGCSVRIGTIDFIFKASTNKTEAPLHESTEHLKKDKGDGSETEINETDEVHGPIKAHHLLGIIDRLFLFAFLLVLISTSVIFFELI
jgi:hypothetical protein